MLESRRDKLGSCTDEELRVLADLLKEASNTIGAELNDLNLELDHQADVRKGYRGEIRHAHAQIVRCSASAPVDPLPEWLEAKPSTTRSKLLRRISSLRSTVKGDNDDVRKVNKIIKRSLLTLLVASVR